MTGVDGEAPVRLRRADQGPHPAERPRVSGLHPRPRSARSTARRYCLQDDLAQVVLLVQQEADGRFGYAVPTTWRQWAAIGQKVATQHPGYVIGTSGESFSHWIYFWGDQCPLREAARQPTADQSLRYALHRDGQPAHPAHQDGTVPPLSVFTPDFAKKYGGANDKVLMMPGPSWYAQAVFQAALHIPAGQITAAMPLQWKNETPITTGQVGGGPWIVSRHSRTWPRRPTSSSGPRPCSIRPARTRGPVTRPMSPWPTAG